MAITHLKGNNVTTVGELPAVGSQLPDFTVVLPTLEEKSLSDFADKRIVLNIFPSVDTGVCAMSVRTFNERAAALADTAVVCISQDLPFALARFCGAEGIENVTTGSAFRSSFGEDYGIKLVDGPMAGLLGRAVVVADEQGKVLYAQLVDEITTEPDYDAALAVL